MLPVFICLSRMGVTMSFNMGYVSVPKLFPVKFQSTVYATVNLFAHIIACLAPIVAELNMPIPHFSYLAALTVALMCCTQLKEMDQREEVDDEKDDEDKRNDF